MSDPARTVVVVGATGVVGRALVHGLADAGWTVIAVARGRARLDEMYDNADGVRRVVGSIGSEAEAAMLADALAATADRIDAVVIAINSSAAPSRLLDLPLERLAETLRDNLFPHHCAARFLLPLVAPGGQYLAIGGGMADFTLPGTGAISICQAAQRHLLRFYAAETKDRHVLVRELMLFAMIVDARDEATADARSIRSIEVAAHIRAILERPDDFPGPILSLKTRAQAGQSDRVAE